MQIKKVYNVISDSGKKQEYDFVSEVCGDTCSRIVSKNGKFGVIKSNGDIALKLRYSNIIYYKGYFIVTSSENLKKGLLDENLNWIRKCIFDNIRIPNLDILNEPSITNKESSALAHTLVYREVGGILFYPESVSVFDKIFEVSKDGKVAFLDIEKNEILNNMYFDKIVDLDSQRYLVINNGKMNLLNISKKLVSKTWFNSISKEKFYYICSKKTKIIYLKFDRYETPIWSDEKFVI